MNNQKIYISLTSIFQNQDILIPSLISILNQSKLPDKIYIYLSEKPYLLDEGFKNKIITNNKLQKIINDNKNLIQIEWTANMGPYRKLLPLLQKKWNEDCIIITIDDDTVYHSSLIHNLLKDYEKYKCVINYRGFTPKCNEKLTDFAYKRKYKKLKNLSLYNFPTGKGGILYKPSFFHKTKDLMFNYRIFLKTCKTNDDIWFYLLRIKNGVKCYLDNKQYSTKDLTRNGLYKTFNNVNNKNTRMVLRTLKRLKNI